MLILCLFWSFHALASIQDTSKIFGLKVDLRGNVHFGNLSIDYLLIFKRFQWQSSLGLDGISYIEYWIGDIEKINSIIPKDFRKFQFGPSPYISSSIHYRYPFYHHLLGVSLGSLVFYNSTYHIVPKNNLYNNTFFGFGFPIKLDYKNLIYISFAPNWHLSRVDNLFNNWSYISNFHIGTLIPLKLWKK